MSTIRGLLAEQPFLAGLDATNIDQIAACAREEHYASDVALIAAGDDADRFWLIRSGRVAVEVDTPSGGPIILETLGPGEVLGVSWVLPPYRTTFDARTVDPTDAWCIDAVELRARCERSPELAAALFHRFAGVVHDRLQAARLQLLDLYGRHER